MMLTASLAIVLTSAALYLAPYRAADKDPGERHDRSCGICLHALHRARPGDYIPYIGPLIAVVLPVLFANAQFASWQAVILKFAGLYAIQFFIGNYFEPMITGKALGISPFIMLVAFFFWAFLWGIPGAFIGLPVTIALFTIFEWNPSSRWMARLVPTSDSAVAD
jgi:AI-2E family transporter